MAKRLPTQIILLIMKWKINYSKKTALPYFWQTRNLKIGKKFKEYRILKIVPSESNHKFWLTKTENRLSIEQVLSKVTAVKL